MSPLPTSLLQGWLLTYLVHSTLLLGAAWLVCRALSERHLAARELVWRLALFGGLVTATVQMAVGLEPVGGRWSMDLAASAPPPVEAIHAAAPTRLALDALRLPLAPQYPVDSPVVSPVVWLPPTAVWGRRLALAFAATSALLLLVLATSYCRFRWRIRNRSELTDPDLRAFLQRLEDRVDSPQTVRLTESSRVGVPLARGLRRWEVCLPSAALDLLPLERQEIVLAHEVAHLGRRDPLWFTLARVLERALFLQPLNILARRSLQEIAEFRCDDWAVEVTRRPISLAKCLTEVAEWSLRARGSVPVPTMAARKSNLGRRVSRLLERSYPMPNEKPPRWLVPSALALLALTVLVAPGVSAHSSDTDPPPRRPAEVAPAPEAPPAPPVTPVPPGEDGTWFFFDGKEVYGEWHPGSVADLEAEIADFAAAAEDIELDMASMLAAGSAEAAEAAETLKSLGQAEIAEMTRRFAETVRPSAEDLERIHAHARRMAESHARMVEEREAALLRLETERRERLERSRAEYERSRIERQAMLERARRAREEAIAALDGEQHERLREEMLRVRAQLVEQLELVERALARAERDRQDPKE